jgi:hypothetical protein
VISEGLSKNIIYAIRYRPAEGGFKDWREKIRDRPSMGGTTKNLYTESDRENR